MSEIVRFSSIESLFNLSKEVSSLRNRYSLDLKGVTVDLTGYVKVHGSNFGISLLKDGELQFQSRERVLNLAKDNFYNAFNYIFSNVGEDSLKTMLKPFLNDTCESVILYGELFGKGVQGKVGVSNFDTSFMAFSLVRVYLGDDNEYYKEHLDINLIPSMPEKRFYKKTDFKTFQYSLKLDNIQGALDDLMKLTLEVEECCPVAYAIDPTIDIKTGEGIVWEGRINTPDFKKNITFKTKGDKHKRGKDKSGGPRVKSEKIYTEEQNEAIQKFIELTVTEDRLEQGFEYFINAGISFEMKNMRYYLEWIQNDIHKEHTHEFVDIVGSTGLDWKPINRNICSIAVERFKQKLLEPEEIDNLKM